MRPRIGLVEIPFPIGEIVWWTGYGSREEWETCPECAGTRVITLVQGNGERVSIDCACCSHGYEGPRGVVSRRIYERAPVPFVCARVSVDGDKVRYSESPPDATAYQMVDAADLFRDKDECARRCVEINAEQEKQEATRLVANLASKRRDMAWSVHYWGRKVKDLERDLAAARARLAVCKKDGTT